MITDDNWQKVQAYGTPYLERSSVGVSRCHWFAPELQVAFRHQLVQLPAEANYLELGTFLGAGSTAIVLETQPQWKVVCMDHWNITGSGAKHWQPEHAQVPDTDQLVDFLQGRGSAFAHFCNNTFDDRHRVVPIRRSYCDQTLQDLAELGFTPDLILIDDDHQRAPVLQRMRQIHRLWPQAQLVLDDYTEFWPGVIKGFDQARAEGLYPGARCTLLEGRLMWVQPAA